MRKLCRRPGEELLVLNEKLLDSGSLQRTRWWDDLSENSEEQITFLLNDFAVDNGTERLQQFKECTLGRRTMIATMG